jgi:hypothetical protein
MHIDAHVTFLLVTVVAGLFVVVTGALLYCACALGARADRDYEAKRDSYLSGIW